MGWVPRFWGRRCRVNYSWVGDGAAVEEDGIAQGAVVGIVGVEVEVLAGGELGDEDKRGEREALIVDGVFVAGRFAGEGADGINSLTASL